MAFSCAILAGTRFDLLTAGRPGLDGLHLMFTPLFLLAPVLLRTNTVNLQPLQFFGHHSAKMSV